MKAIAFAIMISAYLLWPTSEFDKLPEWGKFINVIIYFICFIGFWVNIFTEK